MKRSWMGLVLLVILFFLSVLTAWAMARIQEPVARDLELAARYGAEENWPQAERHARAAAEAWKKWNRLRSCFADHGPVEEIDGSLAALEVYLGQRERTAFCAACADLSRQIQAVGDAHGLVWWNVM